MTATPSTPYSTGDKVRHRQRPEWGIGSVTKIETVTLKGVRDQRIWIRFPNAGLKTVLASLADLDRADAKGSGNAAGAGNNSAPAAPVVAGDEDTLVAREARHEGGWLGEIAKRKPEDAMTSLPATASDRFLSSERRLEFVLGLYRFEPTGGKLIDWAVAQSGLDDPLSRFNRHQLEAFFERWAYERDLALLRVVQEARLEAQGNPLIGEAIEARLAKASPAAQKAMRRLTASR
ncbi:MAG: DUF3553 domain-containing protein [Phycisphaerae bacterium]|nr:DUF3553 domain-containing protein [Phycisphaerae bacterium]